MVSVDLAGSDCRVRAAGVFGVQVTPGDQVDDGLEVSRAAASAVAMQAQAVVKALLLTRASPSFSATSEPLRVMSPWARSAIGPRSPWPI